MRILRMPEVKAMTGLSSASIYKQIREKKFPRGIKITQRAIAWPEKTVLDWIEKKVKESTNYVEVSQ